MATPTEDKVAPDWERIEADYRAGIKSLREIVAPYDLTEGALRKRAKRDSWTRDLSAKIKAKADDLVRKAAVRTPSTQLTAATEKEVVDANAHDRADAVLKQQSMAGRLMRLVENMASELELETTDPALFAQLGHLMDQGIGEAKADKVAETYQKIMALPGRVETMKKLAEAFEKVVRIQRLALGMDDPTPPPLPPSADSVSNDTARRIAFLLAKGLQAQKG